MRRTIVENQALVLDLLEWLDASARPYRDVMDAWRTSCPRLPIWEDARDHDFVRVTRGAAGLMVEITPAGRTFLRDVRTAVVSRIPGANAAISS